MTSMTSELSSRIVELLDGAESTLMQQSPELVEMKMHELSQAQDDIQEATNLMRKRKGEISQQIADMELLSDRLGTAKGRLNSYKFSLIRSRKDNRAE